MSKFYRPPTPRDETDALEEALQQRSFVERSYKIAMSDSSLSQHLAEVCSMVVSKEIESSRQAELRGVILRNLQKDYMSYKDEVVIINPQRFCNLVMFMGVFFKRVQLDNAQPMKVLIHPLYDCLSKLTELAQPYENELRKELMESAVKVLHTVLLESGEELLLYGERIQMEEFMNNVMGLLLGADTAPKSREKLLEVLENIGRWSKNI